MTYAFEAQNNSSENLYLSEIIIISMMFTILDFAV